MSQRPRAASRTDPPGAQQQAGQSTGQCWLRSLWAAVIGVALNKPWTPQRLLERPRHAPSALASAGSRLTGMSGAIDPDDRITYSNATEITGLSRSSLARLAAAGVLTRMAAPSRIG